MKKIFSSVAVLLLFGFAFSGCGYSTRSLLPADLKTVHIPNFENKIDYTKESVRDIYIPLLEVNVRNAVINRFLFDGNLRVAQEEAADLILYGQLTAFQRDGLRFSDADDRDVEEYRIRVIVSISLWDTKKQEMLWEEPSFAGEATYFTTGALARSENEAISDAITDLSRRIVERTIEDW